MIIGITGFYASGKDSVAEYLIGKGFQHYSLSDEIRLEAKKRKITLTRENLIKLGNELREKFGAGILAERIKYRLNKEKDYVLTSFRNPEEVKVFQEKADFMFISVAADIKKRFEWLKQRAREEDPKTFEEFVEKEKIENSSEEHKQQLGQCQKLAKIVLKNEGTKEELFAKVEQLLVNLRKRFYHRPSWDEYFMDICAEIGKRATCDRGRTGCLIVREKRILCTGYVGSPIGMPHCDEIGHLMKTMVHEDGSKSQHCVRTIHAEQNALCQAAREGISLREATLYCKLEPCSVCAKMIVNCGIKRVVCEKRYHAGKETRELFKKAGVRLDCLQEEMERYPGQ